jgi:hypothetical protein
VDGIESTIPLSSLNSISNENSPTEVVHYGPSEQFPAFLPILAFEIVEKRAARGCEYA